MKNRELRAGEREFLNYIRGQRVEQRSGGVNIGTGDNGAIIPEGIVKDIIQKLHDISPLYKFSSVYSLRGEIQVPYYDESEQELKVSYIDEFDELTSSVGELKTIKLNGFLAGVLTKISRSLFYNSDFDLIDFVSDAMAKAIHKWLENELINGTEGKIEGLKGVVKEVETLGSNEITVDELIKLQEMLIDEHQINSIWIMNRKTRKAIRQLKDQNGSYLLKQDSDSRWGYTLLGREVYTTSNMPSMEPGKVAIYYGDFSGLAVQFPKNIEVRVNEERYFNEHAIAVISWVEVDSKVSDLSKIAKIVMKEEELQNAEEFRVEE